MIIKRDMILICIVLDMACTVYLHISNIKSDILPLILLHLYYNDILKTLNFKTLNKGDIAYIICVP